MTHQIDFAKVKQEYRSLKAWAARLKIPYTTVIGWRDSGRVPHWRIERVAETANNDGKDIFGKPSKRKQRAAA